MSKSSKDKIHEDTKMILEELQNNANKSINEIANQLGFSRQKVWRVIKNLEKNNTIWGYKAIVDEEKTGLQQYIILIKRTLKPLDKKLSDLIISKKLEKLVPKKNVRIKYSYYTHGSYDWIICIKTDNITNAKLFCEILIKTYHGYIKSFDLIQILFQLRENGILNPEAKKLHEFIETP